ncbi:hypothetical protein [Actinoplanes philippinensis]|uniref:hypothetical protein n=1 Tax=Actinoplanes philippinensis TaxID=35752 RepID=UPI0033C3F44A
MTQVDVAEAGAGVPRGWIRAVLGVAVAVAARRATAVAGGPLRWPPGGGGGRAWPAGAPGPLS